MFQSISYSSPIFSLFFVSVEIVLFKERSGICWLVYQVDIFTDSGISSVQFSHSVVSNSVTAWTAARQASLSITNSRSLLKLMSVESVMSSDHLIPCCSLLRLQSFPASGSFPMCQSFTSGGQSIGVSASASVFLMDIQD